ncbi:MULTISPECIES: Imm47 family immunity protein [unclassified Brevibacillus]
MDSAEFGQPSSSSPSTIKENLLRATTEPRSLISSD